ncbi:carboxypeptidase-like protein [Ichthyenterobacterium magnum]|uniref:Carboxypeptidase-like protein n=2 Tax=Ichthyenterobacterium magnum TaxID=1230530 RepID=A0A420DXC6_9FLAO|nr:carboxypeptidase-like protein [Ichthyenterobacterium magnum]
MVLFFLLKTTCFSQHTIKGVVTEKVTNQIIPFVNILVKTQEGNLIDFTSTNESGYYSIEMPKKVDSLRIETSIISHLPKSELLILEKSKNKYTLNFSLQQRLTELDEVYIESEKKPIIVKKDTTIYNLIEFKDGSERVVEDLLKKLPGIIVEDSGLIKFKGKQVTRVLLDGDNLFNENYSVGTKNIDSEIVESVQAIEDYNTNPLLKGIKSSQDVAVNLMLKKGVTDISGNAEIGLGIENKKYLKTNVISVSKKLKGFSTLSYNNIGENYSPYNFLSNTFDLSKANEINQRTSNLVSNNAFNSALPDNRTRVNNNVFGSLNSLFKFNKKTSFKLNYNIFKDKLIRNESISTIYNFDNEQINISNQKSISKRPLIHTFEYDLIYEINKKSRLTSIGKLDSQNIKNTSSGFNNNNSFDNIIESEDLFLKNDLEYTYRINNSNVFQISTNISTNKIPQNVNVLNEINNLKQNINFKKNKFEIQSSLLSKTPKGEYSISLGYDFIENFVNSSLQGSNINNQLLSNNIYYKLSVPYADFRYQLRINKWQFIANLSNRLFNVMLDDVNLDTNLNISTFVTYPSISINYFFNSKANFYTDYRLSNQVPQPNTVFSGLILTNNRAYLNNDFKFKLFNNHSSTLGYRINDFYNLFQFNIYASYNFSKYGLINKFNVNENTDFYTSIVDITNNKNLNFGLNFEKYLHFLKSTININSSYSISKYQNIINTSGLRKNESKSLLGEFHIRTGLKGSFNLENKALFINNTFSTTNATSNVFATFQNDFKIKYNKKGFNFIINSQYFNPNLNSNISGDFFLDALVRYKTKKGKIEYQIKANNLLNNQIYQNINTSDFSRSVFQHNLQERFMLLSVQFKF